MSTTPPFPSPTRLWHSTAQPASDPTRPELSAKGKSVLITGGGVGGIGGETARSFAAAGASRIAILGRRVKPLLENKTFIESTYPGVEVVTITADVTKQADVHAAFAHFAADGNIDVLIASAATVGPKDSIADVDGEAFLETVQQNVAAALGVSKAFMRHAAPDAVVVAINSWAAYWSAGKNIFEAYNVAKIAVFRLWDCVGLANPGWSVFHTQPGVVLTEMNLRLGGAASFEGVKTDDGE
jgi:NAD(P)-dependent dehydrogenase (short-subunit alcohol dehydrogenase family)